MYKTILLLLAIFKGCKISGYTPVNSAAVAGKPMIMPCGVHPNETMYRPTVEWKFQSINNTQTELLFNGYNIMRSELDLFIRNDTEGEFHLEKNRTQLKDAGAYHCIKRIHQNQSLRTETNIAQLTILESDPVCGSNTSNGSIVEGDHLQMWCSVNYSGNLAPVMEWSRSDGRIVDSTVIYSNDTFPRTVLSSSFQMTNYSDHYACKTYFKKAHVDSQKEGTSSATNAPDYQAECNLTLNVLFKPRDLLISPIKTTYYNGDIIYCSASGNPTPMYEWIDVDTGYRVNGPTLIVDDGSGEGKAKTYRCNAENVVSGEKKIASEDIKVHIAIGSLFGNDLKYIALLMGIICAMLLIIVLYLGRKHGCFVNRTCICISAHRRGSGTEPDVLPNADGNTSNCMHELEPYGQSTMTTETGVLGIASINSEQKVGPGVKAAVPIYADIDTLYKPESSCKADSLAGATKKQTLTKMSVGLDGTVYMEINADGDRHRSQAAGVQFQSPLFDKSEYASIDHTTLPPPAPQK